MNVNKEIRIPAINNMVSVPTMWDTLRVPVKLVLPAMDTTAQVLESVKITALKYTDHIRVVAYFTFLIAHGATLLF